MEITQNPSEFDKRQLKLISEIVRSIKNRLSDNGIPDDQLAGITSDVAFTVASIIDGSRVMYADGKPLIPVLTFADDEARTKLIAQDGGSSMHGYVEGTVDEIC